MLLVNAGLVVQYFDPEERKWMDASTADSTACVASGRAL